MEVMSKINFPRLTNLNFVVLAVFGAVLRYMLCFPSGLNYMHILHAHSHFAFAGWVFMAMALIIVRRLGIHQSLAVNCILLLTVISSFGMLIAFSIQGYKAPSIMFSTLFMVLSYWFGYLVLRKLRGDKRLFAKLLRGSVFCLIFSSIGPLALAALKANGNTGIIYQNAIYFYLHFQMNGWMMLGVLSFLFYDLAADEVTEKRLKSWLNPFLMSTVFLFFMFTLWSNPPAWVYLISFLASLVNAVSWLKIAGGLKPVWNNSGLLIKTAVLALSLKVLFQVLVGVPAISEWALHSRNLIIGYVHLITLACVTPVLIAQFDNFRFLQTDENLERKYIILTMIYLFLLFIQPVLSALGLTVPYYQTSLLVVSVLYCCAGILFFRRTYQNLNFNFSQPTLNQVLYESSN